MVLAVLTAMVSSAAYASGGFTCTDATGLSVYGGTGRVVGNPLISDVTVDYRGQTIARYPKSQVMGYWNHGNEIRVLVSDADMIDSVAEIRVSGLDGNDDGLMTLTALTSYGKTIVRKNVKVSCMFE